MHQNEEKFAARTDLAIEARELAREKSREEKEPDGVEVENLEEEDYVLTRVRIRNEAGSRIMGKPVGSYITLESQSLKENDIFSHEAITKALARELRELAGLEEGDTVLIAGLGNWNITPDALGPKVVSKVLVTRHLGESLPEEILRTVRPVAAVSPGVMGITGIETGEIIKGIVEKMRPKLLIAVDALAARKTGRINAAIQLSDTGLAPGAGVGNKRKLLSKETLGIPVIAIGVPTVVDAATLVNDTMDRMLEEMSRHTEKNTPFYEMLRSMEGEEKYELITELLDPYAENMFVTPKEVDAVIDRLSGVIANAVNLALHPGITMEDLQQFLA
ncbi:GPR endopeptidase [Anaerotignum lactatifermentans]|uniref:GPR endopeptidase n=1 Tax=Anaerotignum lactatifermentans TaxID=160404 RepID=UPI001FAEE84C|nr:GPR endopeptidase [Anaerotignum lactatifermentans]